LQKNKDRMSNLFNEDFTDFIAALNKYEVEYVLVGGYSVVINGYKRTTGDMDIFVKKHKDNYKKLKLAFKFFGMPVFDMTEKNFLLNEKMNVFTFGRQPNAIEILTSISGTTFDDVFESSQWYNTGEVNVKVIHISQLKINKRASGRPKDLDDLENL
jgi:hypothetical protein